jgi:hypothetical protein
MFLDRPDSYHRLFRLSPKTIGQMNKLGTEKAVQVEKEHTFPS